VAMGEMKLRLNRLMNFYPYSGGIEGPDWEWMAMEDCLKSADPNSVVMDIRSAFDRKYSVQYLSSSPSLSSSVTVVNEFIHIDMEISNPLHIPIQLESVQLACTHHPEGRFAVKPRVGYNVEEKWLLD
jgi:hypothetical protein